MIFEQKKIIVDNLGKGKVHAVIFPNEIHIHGEGKLIELSCNDLDRIIIAYKKMLYIQ